MIIHPRITGTVHIEMSHDEAKVLRDALKNVIDRDAPEWVEKKIRHTTDGETCNRFLKALQSVTT